MKRQDKRWITKCISFQNINEEFSNIFFFKLKINILIYRILYLTASHRLSLSIYWLFRSHLHAYFLITKRDNERTQQESRNKQNNIIDNNIKTVICFLVNYQRNQFSQLSTGLLKLCFWCLVSAVTCSVSVLWIKVINKETDGGSSLRWCVSVKGNWGSAAK